MADLDDDLETLLANRRRARSEKSAGFCSQCGGPFQKSDRFCPKCGAKVIET
jgi:predicted amidophosphoribosyltransferase